MKRGLAIGVMASLSIVSCALDMKPSVGDILNFATRHNGHQITVRGRISSRHGLLSLFNRSAKQCIGLILTPSERLSFSKYVEREISVTGTFQADGCGRDGVCDEHLCGPGVLTHVTLLSGS